MDVIELLKRQHEEVRDVLERIIAEDDVKESRMLLGQVSTALRLHMLIEEKVVYPAATRAFAGDEDDEETILESYESHAVARRCLEVLEGTAPNDKRFIVRAKIVKEILEKHIEEEEEEMFPELEAKLGQDGIRKLGDQVERRLGDLESESTRGRGAPRARRGERGGRARPSQTGRATSGRGRGAAAPARRTTRKAPSRTKAISRSNGSRDTNGNKPRRGESTSRH